VGRKTLTQSSIGCIQCICYQATGRTCFSSWRSEPSLHSFSGYHCTFSVSCILKMPCCSCRSFPWNHFFQSVLWWAMD